jgi:hypothetical protein
MPTLTCPNININPLRLTGYNFSISKLPDLPFFIQEVEIPSISLGVSRQSTSVHDLKIPGETMEYAELTFSFVVDEEMKNWNAIYYWLVALGYPEGHEMYRRFVESSKNMGYSELSKSYSDGFLTILDNANNPKQTFTFVDMFPISLTGIRYDSTQQEATTAIAQATFEYNYYTINKPPENY